MGWSSASLWSAKAEKEEANENEKGGEVQELPGEPTPPRPSPIGPDWVEAFPADTCAICAVDDYTVVVAYTSDLGNISFQLLN